VIFKIFDYFERTDIGLQTDRDAWGEVIKQQLIDTKRNNAIVFKFDRPSSA